MKNNVLMRSIVLVVDDHPETLQLLIDALEDAGVTVLVATGGQRALDQVAHLLPDLILLDAVMPGMDGFEACRALKSGPAAEVPVIFMTGLEDTEHIVRGLEAGGIDYLKKPIAPDELLARMRIHLSNARAAEGARKALDASGRTLLASDAHGEIRWATPQAQRILAKLAGAAPDAAAPRRSRLPPEVRAWVSLPSSASLNESVVVVAQDLRVRFRVLSRVTEDETLLVIQQADPVELERGGMGALQKRFSLTVREAEVLYWLSRGKSNRDIADILRLSSRTVDKHLEHVYTKIGVESRAGAVAASVQVLGA
jgi:DNA-binding response OmpR family regulator/DNA-binding CsgD family transcriptional regulator